MTDRRINVRDMDPQKAPDKTAQDLIDTLKSVSRTNDHPLFGMTTATLHGAFRCDTARLGPFLKRCELGGYLVRQEGRYHPQDILWTATYLDIMGPARFKIKPDKNGKWRIICSWCGMAQKRSDTQGEAQAYLEKTKHHENFISHSLERSKVLL